jgi:hypothetical protein
MNLGPIIIEATYLIDHEQASPYRADITVKVSR